MKKDFSLCCNEKILAIEKPLVMGILNITPDSFYDGGTLKDDRSVLKQAEKHLSQGATFLDVGGYSTRPGAQNISIEEELGRVIPVIELLQQHFPESLVSIDTFRSTVARKSVETGACIINDISGGDFDSQMFETVRELQVPYVLMHIRDNPDTMQQNPEYEDVVKEVIQKLSEKTEKLHLLGVNDVIIDPGFGFGKTVQHNLQLLRHLNRFSVFDLPLLAGLSRKSMLKKILGAKPAEALNGTTVVNTLALLNGANILRVHDVKEAMEAIQIVQEYKIA